MGELNFFQFQQIFGSRKFRQISRNFRKFWNWRQRNFIFRDFHMVEYLLNWHEKLTVRKVKSCTFQVFIGPFAPDQWAKIIQNSNTLLCHPSSSFAFKSARASTRIWTVVSLPLNDAPISAVHLKIHRNTIFQRSSEGILRNTKKNEKETFIKDKYLANFNVFPKELKELQSLVNFKINQKLVNDPCQNQAWKITQEIWPKILAQNQVWNISKMKSKNHTRKFLSKNASSRRSNHRSLKNPQKALPKIKFGICWSNPISMTPKQFMNFALILPSCVFCVQICSSFHKNLHRCVFALCCCPNKCRSSQTSQNQWVR